jgi:hypothetical protein
MEAPARDQRSNGWLFAIAAVLILASAAFHSKLKAMPQLIVMGLAVITIAASFAQKWWSRALFFLMLIIAIAESVFFLSGWVRMALRKPRPGEHVVMDVSWLIDLLITLIAIPVLAWLYARSGRGTADMERRFVAALLVVWIIEYMAHEM